MTVSEQFGKNLRAERTKANMSQEQLAFRAGLHRTEIGMLERGIRLCRIDTLVKLAGALEIAPDQLLQEIIWSAPDLPSGKWRLPQRG